MSKNKHFNPDGKEFLKLTQWELENLHLPPVTTTKALPRSSFCAGGWDS